MISLSHEEFMFDKDWPKSNKESIFPKEQKRVMFIC